MYLTITYRVISTPLIIIVYVLTNVFLSIGRQAVAVMHLPLYVNNPDRGKCNSVLRRKDTVAFNPNIYIVERDVIIITW